MLFLSEKTVDYWVELRIRDTSKKIIQSNTHVFFLDETPMPTTDIDSPFRHDQMSSPNYPAHSPFDETVPVLHSTASPFYQNGTLPVTATSTFIHNANTPSGGEVDVSCVKQEPGFPSNFPMDPTRRTVSMDSPYPFHIKKELNPMYVHESVRRQISMPPNPSVRTSINLENRRSSEPAIIPTQFPQTNQHPFQMTPSATPMPYPGTPTQSSLCQLETQQRPDLYLVNLATYHHHQEMETIKRRKLTKGEDYAKKIIRSSLNASILLH